MPVRHFFEDCLTFGTLYGDCLTFGALFVSTACLLETSVEHFCLLGISMKLAYHLGTNDDHAACCMEMDCIATASSGTRIRKH